MFVKIDIQGGSNDIRLIESLITGESKNTMTRNYRDDFSGIMSDSDYADLLTGLRNNTAQYPITITAGHGANATITHIETVYNGETDEEYIRFNGHTVKTIACD